MLNKLKSRLSKKTLERLDNSLCFFAPAVAGWMFSAVMALICDRLGGDTLPLIFMTWGSSCMTSVGIIGFIAIWLHWFKCDREEARVR